MEAAKQNLILALCCGWKLSKSGDWKSPNDTKWQYPPIFTKDLHAMSQAEGQLSIRQQQQYVPILRNICCVAGTWPEMATAAQRAEAFLRALELWEE